MSLGFHSFVYYKNGDLKACGMNNHGQLGIEKEGNVFIPELVMNDPSIKCIRFGEYHTMILTETEVLVMGSNEYGQLGLKNKLLEKKYGNHRNVYGISNPLTLIKEKIKEIACGSKHSFFLKENGDLYSFGCNNDGQLGLKSPKVINKPTKVLKNIIKVSCGAYHTMALNNEGELFAFGDNRYGQLGLGDQLIQKQITPIKIMLDKKIKFIECGWLYTFIYKSNGECQVMGANSYGQLGLGNNTPKIFEPTLQSIDQEIKVISCGSQHTIILKNNGD
eukprot:TRINITY_DN2864_c0_g1_i1.p1 TRINITY_DN2864_c0_g1~~TRINITY_DN2864_c0_g1_i1.p1  ORF type:complete len:277 (+),score=56.00 TRINITY_DN2864_c0_g1_i1:20-850(+)